MDMRTASNPEILARWQSIQNISLGTAAIGNSSSSKWFLYSEVIYIVTSFNILLDLTSKPKRTLSYLTTRNLTPNSRGFFGLHVIHVIHSVLFHNSIIYSFFAKD